MTQKRNNHKFLMLYVRKSMNLTLVLSVGALILVFAMSTAGGFSYFLQKRSISVTIEESPVDLIISQKYYLGIKGQLVHPLYLADAVTSLPYVENVTILATKPLEVNITTNYERKGNDTICIVGLWSRKPINVTLSQGNPPAFSLNWTEAYPLPPRSLYNILVSEDFFHKYDIALGESLLLSTHGWKPVNGIVSGATPLRLSQLIEELGIQDSMFFAGYDKTKLASLDQYPLVVAHINLVTQMLASKMPGIPSTFFVKLNQTAFLNPWDVDITVSNLKGLGRELLLNVNNASSTYVGKEFKPAFIQAWPTAAILQELSGFININRLTVFAFGFTMAVVGWYFYGMLSQAVITARVGELQLIHIRGASRKSLSNSVAVMVVVAGITGTIVGIFLSYLFTVAMTTYLLGVTIAPEDLSMAFSVYSLVIYSLFGLAAALLSQRRVFSQIGDIKLSGGERELPSVEKGWGLAGTLGLIVAFSLGVMKAVSWIFGLDIIGEGQAINPITSAFLLLIRLLDRTVLDALGALFLAYALVNFVAMEPRVLSATVHAVSCALSKPLALLSKRIIQGKSARMVGGMIITSLLILNVVSAHLGHAGVEAAWTNLSIAVIGADVRIDMQEEAVPYVFQSLDNMSDLAGFTQILFVKEAVLGTPLAGTPAYIIDSAEYATLVDGIGHSFLNVLKSMPDLGIVVSNFFHDIGVLDQGDLVKLGDKELTVMDFVSYLPGTFSVPSLDRFAVVDAKTTEGVDYIILSRTVLVKVGEYQPEEVVEDIIKGLPSNMTKLCTLATRSSAMSEFSQRMSISEIAENVMSLLFVASLVSVAFAITAIGVMAYSEAIERRSLDALLRIRGVTRRQLLSMILSEALTFFLFSLIIGFFTGYVMACGYTAYFSTAFPIHASPILASELVIQLLTLLAIYLVVSLAPSLCIHPSSESYK